MIALPAKFYIFSHGMCTMYFFMVGLYMLTRRPAIRSRRMLGWVLLMIACIQLKHVWSYRFPDFCDCYSTRLLATLDSLAVCISPFYLYELISPRWLTLKRAAMLVAPFATLIALYAITADLLFFRILAWLTLIYVIVAVTTLAICTGHYVRTLKDHYSSPARVNVTWLAVSTIIMLTSLAMWSLTIYYQSWWFWTGYTLCFMLMWSVIAYFGNRYSISSLEYETEGAEADSTALPELQQRLHTVMNEECAYLHPDLTLKELARLVGTNRTSLSRVLNSELGMSFYDYVNSFRLARACSMLSDPACADMSIASICADCGFNSRATFNRLFTRANGVSPSDYRASHNGSAD